MIVRYVLDCAYIRRMVTDSISRAEVLSWLLHLRSALQQNAYLLVDERGKTLGDLVEAVEYLKTEEADRDEVSCPLIQLRALLNELMLMCHRSILVPPDLQNFGEFVGCCYGLHRPDGIITDNPEITERSREQQQKKNPKVLTISSFPTSTVEQTRRGWIGKRTFDGKNVAEFIEYADSFARGSQSIEIMDRLIWGSERKDYIVSMGYWLCLFACAGVRRITVVSKYSDKLHLPEILGSLKAKIKMTNIPRMPQDAKLDIVIDTKKEDGGDDFHDRFAISDTHYFAVGRGFDVLRSGNRSDNWRLFNTYFCGHRTGFPGADAVDSKDITKIRSLPSQRPSLVSLPPPEEMSDSTGKKITVAVSFAADIDHGDNF